MEVDLLEKDLTESIIGAAMDVHRILGPGLLESAYEACFCHELELRDLKLQRQVHIPIQYKGIEVPVGYRADAIVESRILIELKAVEQMLPIHEAQLITYLKLTGIRVGLLMNFNVAILKTGIIRRVL